MKSGRTRVLLAALAYVIVGWLTANLTGHANTPQVRTFWRLAAWVVSAAIFSAQIGHDRVRIGGPAKGAAWRAALAVAIGALGIAIIGPVRAHWAAGDFWRSAILSVVLWPVLTGIPAFMVAWAIATGWRRNAAAYSRKAAP